MKKITFLLIFVLTVTLGFGQKSDIATSGGTIQRILSSGSTKQLYSSPSVIWDNGPLVNSPGTGTGGSDESILQTSSLGMYTLGFGCQTSAGNWMADDFELSSPQEISQVLVYGYQTGSSTTSTITEVYLQIYDGVPGAGGSVVWGNAVTNRMASSEWSGIYRAADNNINTSRPIMVCTCDINTTLPAGTYWLSVQMNGTLGSGPWYPCVTINGQTTTGNAIQYTGSWTNALDGGTFTPQGMPFVLLGSKAVPFNVYYLLIVFGLIGTGIIVRKRLI